MTTAESSKGLAQIGGARRRSVYAHSLAPDPWEYYIDPWIWPGERSIDPYNMSPERVRGVVSEIILSSDHESLTADTSGDLDGRHLESSSIMASDSDLGARARAILRGIDLAEADLRASGGAYDLDQVRKVMRGISRQAIDRQVKEGRLLAVPGQGARRRYPTLQFNHGGGAVEGLKAVMDALPTRNAWAILNFLANPQDLLGGAKPIDRLRAGRLDEVLAAARGWGEQGA
jgi:hypothetical protein